MVWYDDVKPRTGRFSGRFIAANTTVYEEVEVDADTFYPSLDYVIPANFDNRSNVKKLNISGVPAIEVIYPPNTISGNPSGRIEVFIVKDLRLYRISITGGDVYPIDHPIIEYIINSFKFTNSTVSTYY